MKNELNNTIWQDKKNIYWLKFKKYIPNYFKKTDGISKDVHLVDILKVNK